MINFTNANFIKSASKKSEAPGIKFPEVLLCGRSNVGKSSFINALCNKKRLAFTSSKPGHTRLLNYYNIDDAFYLVDAPGYGYAKGGIDLDKLFLHTMEDYLNDNDSLKLVVFLLDSRRELSDDDINLINYVLERKIPCFAVITKVDKVNQSEKAKLEKHIKEVNLHLDKFYTSILKPQTYGPVRGYIETHI
ncbi:MAG: ribosome biogenesis GTP-binding protein YihA/YsxC [Bacilli bacterium]|nr:ribosome biogenesis GTP-binding protein YihA/YsxC [Bacilli bacterium]